MPTTDTAAPPGAELLGAPPPPPPPGPSDPSLHLGTPPPPDAGEEPVLVESDPVALLFGEEVEPGEPGEASAGAGSGVRVDTNVRFEPSGANPPKPEGVVTPVGAAPDRAAGPGGGQATSAGDGITVTTRVERTASGVIVTVNAVILNK